MRTQISAVVVNYTTSLLFVSLSARANSTSGEQTGIIEGLGTSSPIFEFEEIKASASSETERIERRRKQIDAFAMRGTPTPRPKHSWLNTVGKYPADSPLNRMLERGADIRDSERSE